MMHAVEEVEVRSPSASQMSDGDERAVVVRHEHVRDREAAVPAHRLGRRAEVDSASRPR